MSIGLHVITVILRSTFSRFFPKNVTFYVFCSVSYVFWFNDAVTQLSVCCHRNVILILRHCVLCQVLLPIRITEATQPPTHNRTGNEQ